MTTDITGIPFPGLIQMLASSYQAGISQQESNWRATKARDYLWLIDYWCRSWFGLHQYSPVLLMNNSQVHPQEKNHPQLDPVVSIAA